MRCANCRHDNAADAAFCAKCGKALSPAPRTQPLASPRAALREAPFVGRAKEMDLLLGALARAHDGEGQLVALAGDPGIGKTRTAMHIARQAKQRGGGVIWSRGYEQAGAPPYWPWVQIVRGYMEARASADIARALGVAAANVAEIVPEVAAHVTGLRPAAPIIDAAQARFRVFDAITSFLRRAAEAEPLTLIFDNIHLADESSLRLLEFFVAGIDTSRILAIVTYRDFDLARAHALSNTLGELARYDHFQQIRLTGLARAETTQILAHALAAEPAPELASAVQAQTEGNPLFVVEMARYLAEDAPLNRSSPYSQVDTTARKIPQGIRQVIGLRLSRLSPLANHVLSHAAVIGRTFDARILAHLLPELTEEQLGDALETALAVHAIDELEAPGSYQFSHALIRETLYDEVPKLRRVRLHERIGAVIEEAHAGNLDAHLALLAYHYCAALPSPHTQKAVDYAARAGGRAEALLAYEEAARSFALALQAMDQLEGDAQRRCRLEIRLGIAQTKSGSSSSALQTLAGAARKAKELGAAEDLALAAIAYEEANWRPGLPGKPAVQLLEDALAITSEANAALRARLQAALTRALTLTGQPERAAVLQREALALARRKGEPVALAAALSAAFWLPWDAALVEQRLAHAEEAIALSNQTGNTEKALECGTFQLMYLWTLGNTREFARRLKEHVQTANDFRQRFYQYHYTSVSAAHALFEGRFAEGEQLSRAALELSSGLLGLDGPGIYGTQMFALARERGQLKELAPLIKRFTQTNAAAATWLPALALAYAEIDQPDEARPVFEQLAAADFKTVPRDSLWLTCLTYLAIVCCRLGDQTRARALYGYLLPSESHNVIVASTVLCCGPVALYLGMLAAAGGERDKAEAHFKHATQASTDQGARPWLAHSLYQWAGLCAGRGEGNDHEQALALLEDAIEICKDLGMKALEERASVLREKVESRRAAPTHPSGLSRREIQVLRMIAAGKRNQEIADALFRSPNTVANHVRNILNKINAANRSEAAAFAARHGLLDEN